MKSTLRILLPSVLCVLVIYMTNMSLDFYPLSFGLIIGLVNWDIHKNKPLLGVFLSILVSYTSYLIAYFSLMIATNVPDTILGFSVDAANFFTFIVSPFVIAPLLIFFLYQFVFNIPKTKTTLFVILLSIVFLVLQSALFYYYVDALPTEISDNKILNSYTIWQIVMALAIQIIITQRVNVKGK